MPSSTALLIQYSLTSSAKSALNRRGFRLKDCPGWGDEAVTFVRREEGATNDITLVMLPVDRVASSAKATHCLTILDSFHCAYPKTVPSGHAVRALLVATEGDKVAVLSLFRDREAGLAVATATGKTAADAVANVLKEFDDLRKWAVTGPLYLFEREIYGTCWEATEFDADFVKAEAVTDNVRFFLEVYGTLELGWEFRVMPQFPRISAFGELSPGASLTQVFEQAHEAMTGAVAQVASKERFEPGYDVQSAWAAINSQWKLRGVNPSDPRDDLPR